jgi:DNA-directed RNA polymerase specialized sigma24 family protein
MVRRRALTQTNFDELLEWLDPDREQAAIRYEAIRVSLIKILTWRGCNNGEDLADETINRVAEKVHLLKDTFVGDPAIYFYAVAKRLLKEDQRKAKSQVSISESFNVLEFPPEPGEPTDLILYDCLRSCLRNAGEQKKEMILSYYVGERHVKIENRKAMAERLGIPLNALRVRMHRIRTALERCIQTCVATKMSEANRRQLKETSGKSRIQS